MSDQENQENHITPLSENEESDRGIPSPHSPKKGSNVNKLFFFAIIAIAICLAAFAGMMFVKNLEKERERRIVDERTNKKKDIETAKPKDFNVDKTEIATEEALATPADASGANASTANSQPSNDQNQNQQNSSNNSSNGGQQTNVDPKNTPRYRRLSGDVMVDVAANNVPQQAQANTAEAQSVSFSGPSSSSNNLESSLTSSKFPNGVAARRPDLTHLLRRNTMIPCGLRTKIVTTYPGVTSCLVSKDIYSADGRMLLIEKASEVIGEQRSALVQGQARVFVLWTRIETPKGISVDIDSGGSDTLGASGHEGWVDTHFWQRFGGAMLLSVIDDAFATLANSTSQQGSQVSYQNTTQATNEMAAKALESTINIPPTAYINQGGAINIIVARDVDFRGVYELAHTK